MFQSRKDVGRSSFALVKADFGSTALLPYRSVAGTLAPALRFSFLRVKMLPGVKNSHMGNFVHLYFGDGKGKTTAAMGLALRALGRGKKVCCAQFLKGGESGEITALKTFPGFELIPPPKTLKFVFQMTPEEKAICRGQCGQMLALAARRAKNCDVLILDELCAALRCDMVSEADALALIDAAPCGDIVITGRDPLDSLLQRADYASELRCVRHPYDKGVAAREGIEF